MGDSVAKIVQAYVRQHDSIRFCLERDLINHAALARRISQELHLEDKDEAMCAALRRYVRRRRQKSSKPPVDAIQRIRQLPVHISFRTSTMVSRVCGAERGSTSDAADNTATTVYAYIPLTNISQSDANHTPEGQRDVRQNILKSQTREERLRVSSGVLKLLEHDGIKPHELSSSENALSLSCTISELPKLLNVFQLTDSTPKRRLSVSTTPGAEKSDHHERNGAIELKDKSTTPRILKQ